MCSAVIYQQYTDMIWPDMIQTIVPRVLHKINVISFFIFRSFQLVSGWLFISFSFLSLSHSLYVVCYKSDCS